MRRPLLTTTFAALAGLGTLVVPAAATQSTATHPCATASTVCSGTIEVPLNWADPGSERITVPFTWIPRGGPAAPTVVFLPGGPSAALPSADLFAGRAPGYNTLVVERRGFGRASPLQCPELDVLRPETIAACADRLGPRVQYFTTDQRVADIDAVRAAMGFEKVTLYGVSYGSVDGPAYATRFPERTAAAVFDSPSLLPDRRSGYLTGLTFAAELAGKLRATDAACFPSPACRALPGDAESRVARVAELLREHPDPVVSPGSLGSVIKLLEPFAARDTNAALAAYLNGDKVPLRRLAALTGPPPGSGDPNAMIRNLGTAALAYMCNDATWHYDRLAGPEQRRRQLAEYRRTHPEYPLTTAEFTRGAGLVEEWCVNWPTPRAAPPVEPRVSYPDTPVLVVGGTLDPNAARNAAELAGRFPRGSALVVPFGGHATTRRANAPYSRCALAVVEQFIAQPSQPVRARCSGENFRALGHFPRTGTDPVSTALRTAMDALSMRNPNGGNRLTEVAGLRGGKVVFDDQNRRIALDAVRYVADVAVSGRIDLPGADGTATADLTLSTGSTVTLTWIPYRAEDFVPVTGTVDGRPFTAVVPAG